MCTEPCLLGHLSSGMLMFTVRPPSKGVCTALSSIAWVPSGQRASSGRFQELTAQCNTFGEGSDEQISTYSIVAHCLLQGLPLSPSFHYCSDLTASAFADTSSGMKMLLPVILMPQRAVIQRARPLSQGIRKRSTRRIAAA